MEPMAAYSPNPFDTLPIETTQHIASFLEYDTDICNFRRICRSTADAVDADNCTFWRRRFLSYFEDCGFPRTQNHKYRSSYQNRRKLLKTGAIFNTGETAKERRCLELLRDLVVESFSGKIKTPDQTSESPNLECITRFILSTNLLQVIFKPRSSRPVTTRFNTSTSNQRRNYSSPAPRIVDPKPTDLLLTIQVLCAPMIMSFEPHLVYHAYSFPDSQAVAYSSPTTWPIFGGASGLDVNMEYVLHNINFWKYHMVREDEQTLFWAFHHLEDFERPRWWGEKLSQPSSTTSSAAECGVQVPEKKLGKHWKGSYAYIERDEVEAMRNGTRDISEQIQDCFAGEDAASFQDLQLSLIAPSPSFTTSPQSPSEQKKSFPWPSAFERHLHSLTPPTSPSRAAKTRAQHRHASTSPTSPPSPTYISDLLSQSRLFTGSGTDVAESFHAAGWLNPLPPQQGVPGWQRMTMMKYFEDESDPNGVDVQALWAYEGVVLPGGQVVVGRWWSVVEDDGDGSAGGDGEDGEREEVYSGPFVLWCVDSAGYEDVHGEEGDVVD